jgi:hypothetical protein
VAAPTYLANNFNYLRTTGVTDCTATITRLIAQAVAIGWTNPSGNTIKSAVNGVGQFIKMTFTRISALNLEVLFEDSLGRTFTRRTQMPNPYVEDLYFNTYGMAFDPGNGEGIWGSILDLSPELQDAHDQFAAAHAARDTANTLAGNFQTSAAGQLNSASPRVYVFTNAITILAPRGNLLSATPTAGMLPFSQPGSRLWYPVIQVGPVNSAGDMRIRGRVFQMLYVSESESTGTEIVVPIDGASTGVFKVLAFPVAAVAWRGKMAMRKA